MKSRFHFSYCSGLLAMFVFSSIAAQAQIATEAWVRRYTSAEAGSQDYARKVVTDTQGNVVVAGDTDDGDPNDGMTGADFLIIKYSGAGVPLWTNRYSGPTNSKDIVSGLAVDKNSNVFVTGSSGAELAGDYVTVAYAGTGVPLWTNRYNGPANSEDAATDVAVDHNGNVFVTGYSTDNPGNRGYLTIAYSSMGVPLWTNRYNVPGNSHSRAFALAVDHHGNVFVTGYSYNIRSNQVDYATIDYVTIAYASTGLPLWTNRYNGPDNSRDRAVGVAVDNTGNVFVTGGSVWYDSGASYKSSSATIAYSAAGIPLWTNHFNGAGNAGANALAVDHQGNVFVTGLLYLPVSAYGFNSYYATIAYSPTGVAFWTNFYRGPDTDYHRPDAVGVDHTGNVLVTGTSGEDYATIKYSGAGTALWTNRYDGHSNNDWAYDIAVDSSGNVFVTGVSRADSADFATIAYSAAGVALWTNRHDGPVSRPQLVIQSLTAGSSTMTLTLSGPPNSSCSIQRALTIAGPWADLGLSLTGTNGSVSFIDPNPPANGAFYRVAPPESGK